MPKGKRLGKLTIFDVDSRSTVASPSFPPVFCIVGVEVRVCVSTFLELELGTILLKSCIGFDGVQYCNIG